MSRPLKHCVGPVEFRPYPKRWGPSPDADCPCGSGRKVRSCHGTASGGWVSAPASALIEGPRTGLANKACFLAAAKDCSEQVTREHWISRSILELINENQGLVVSGMAWQPGGWFSVPPSALGARILCGRHNNALSRLDGPGKFAYSTLLGYQRALNDATQRSVSEIALMRGEDLERWMLKLFWGGIASGSLGRDSKPLPGLRADVDQRALADVLTRGMPWPNGWGLYVANDGSRLQEDGHLGVSTGSGDDGHAWECSVSVGAPVLKVAIARLRPGRGEVRHYRPANLAIHYEGYDAHRVLALAWPDRGAHPLVPYTRQAGS